MACNLIETSPTIFSINSDSGLTNKKNTHNCLSKWTGQEETY
jgi:hypothetical protein